MCMLHREGEGGKYTQYGNNVVGLHRDHQPTTAKSQGTKRAGLYGLYCYRIIGNYELPPC